MKKRVLIISAAVITVSITVFSVMFFNNLKSNETTQLENNTVAMNTEVDNKMANRIFTDFIYDIFLYEWYFFQDLSKDWLKRHLKYLLGIFIIFSLISLIYLGFNPIKKKDLDAIRSFNDLIDLEHAQRIVDYKSISVIKIIDDKESNIRETGKSDALTNKQLEFIKASNYSTNLTFSAYLS